MSKKILNRDAFNYVLWDLSVGKIPWNFLDPIIGEHPVIDKSARLVGMGCCFVQHMIKFLLAFGYTRHVVEQPLENYAFFSARYDFQHSPSQAAQLLKAAYGQIEIPDHAGIWRHKGGGWIDALRPGASPVLPDIQSVKEKRVEHFACVRRSIEEAECLLLSFSGIESLASRSTGILYPVSTGNSDLEPTLHDIAAKTETVSSSFTATKELIAIIKRVNPKVKIITAISPMPICFTQFPRQHILVTNSYGKSVLCAVLHEMLDFHKDMHYFPAYEIFSSPYTGGRFYERNMREMTPEGVNFVMRFFLRHFTVDGGKENESNKYAAPENYSDALCPGEDAEPGASIVHM